MKLYIRQKVFSWSDRFIIYDEYERERWVAEGEIFTFGRKLHLYDMSGNEYALIRQKVLSFLSRYYIDIGDVSHEFVREFTFLRPKYSMESTGWEAEGDFWAHEYSITHNGRIVMRMSKAWFTWGDVYELGIPDSNDELLCLCAALAIDCMEADRDNH